MLLYRDCRIPTDWMLDSGMISKVLFMFLLISSKRMYVMIHRCLCL